LNEGGADQLIFDMNNRDDVPGYGYQLKHGATTLTESWPALPVVSNNHLMLGHIMEWFYSGLAGIGQPDNSTAYKIVLIKPEIVGDITWAKASYESLCGVIKSEWQLNENSFELNITIPANSNAVVYLPASQQHKIYEGNTLLSAQKDIQVLQYADGKAIIKVGSGCYHFRVEK
jgi:alpha-L-rhamnosidase